MKLPAGVRRWFRLPKSLEDVEREVEDELDFHITMRMEDLKRAGLPPGIARVRALEEFGDMKQAKEELGAIDSGQLQRARRAEWWSGLAQDVKFSWRSISGQPGLTLAIAVTLGLGLGANATAFNLVDRLLYRAPDHVVDAHEIQRVYFERDFANVISAEPNTAYVDYINMRKNMSTFSDVASFFGTRSTLGRGREAQKIDLGVASASFFTMLGVKPYLGRFYTEKEDGPAGGTPVAVLTYEFWQNRLGGARDIIGRQLLIGKTNFTVIGIAPPHFSGVDLNAMDLWVPVSVIAKEWGGDDWSTTRGMQWLRLIGRLKPGVTSAQAAQQATTVWRSADSVHASRNPQAGVVLGPVQQARGPWEDARERKGGKVASWLAAVSLLVLLVACANAANLLLTRTIKRRRETGIRLALGISRGRLFRQFLVESLLLSALAAVVAIAVSYWGSAAIRATILPQADFATALLDRRLLLFIGVATVFTAVATMAAPAFQMVRESIIPALKSGQRDGQQRSRMRTGLLFVQAVLSVVLLIGAGLFVRSFHNVRSMDMGFDAGQVLIADMDLGLLGYNRDRQLEFFLKARDHIARLGGIEAAGVAGSAPFYSAMMTELRAEGVDSIRAPRTGGPYIVGVTPEYFAASGVSIVRGRGFTRDDVKGAQLVAVINQTMARTLWPNQEALGKCLYVGDPNDKPGCTTVVGIAEDAKKMEISHEPVMDYYVPFAQRAGGLLTLFIRTKGEPVRMLPVVQRELQLLEPNLPYANVVPLQEMVDPQLQSWKMGAFLFSSFGVLALLLSAIGLYSMLSYAVASRTAEMGLRMALGATPRSVMGVVVRDGVAVALAGIAVGATAAFFASQRLAPLLFDVSPADPATYAAASALLMAVALVAATIPARRATRVDPAIALKAE